MYFCNSLTCSHSSCFSSSVCYPSGCTCVHVGWISLRLNSKITNQPALQKKTSPWNHEEIQSASVVDQGHELSPIHRSKRTEEAPGKGEISMEMNRKHGKDGLELNRICPLKSEFLSFFKDVSENGIVSRKKRHPSTNS